MSDITYDGLDGIVVKEPCSIEGLGAPAVADPAPEVEDPVTKAFEEIQKLETRIDKLKSKMDKSECVEAERRRKTARIIASLRCKLRNLERELRGDRQIKAPTPRYDPSFQDRDGLGLAYAIPSAVDRKRKAAEKRDAARKSSR
jgi:hypothetical protein